MIELALGRFPFADEPLDSDDDCDLPGSETTNQAGSVPKQEKKRAGPQGVSLDNNNAGGGGMTMSILDLLQHIVNEPAPKLTPVGKYPKEAELFVDSCLVKDPKERRSPKGLLVSLKTFRIGWLVLLYYKAVFFSLMIQPADISLSLFSSRNRIG